MGRHVFTLSIISLKPCTVVWSNTCTNDFIYVGIWNARFYLNEVISSGTAIRGEDGGAAEVRLVGEQKLHFFGKCTMKYALRLHAQFFLWPVYYATPLFSFLGYKYVHLCRHLTMSCIEGSCSGAILHFRNKYLTFFRSRFCRLAAV